MTVQVKSKNENDLEWSHLPEQVVGQNRTDTVYDCTGGSLSAYLPHV